VHREDLGAEHSGESCVRGVGRQDDAQQTYADEHLVALELAAQDHSVCDREPHTAEQQERLPSDLVKEQGRAQQDGQLHRRQDDAVEHRDAELAHLRGEADHPMDPMQRRPRRPEFVGRRHQH